jgi:hypothetical protein
MIRSIALKLSIEKLIMWVTGYSVNNHEQVQITTMGGLGCNQHTEPSQAPKQVRKTASRHDLRAKRVLTTASVNQRECEQTRARTRVDEGGWERPVRDKRRAETR